MSDGAHSFSSIRILSNFRTTIRVLKFDVKKDEGLAAVEEIIAEDKAAGRLPVMLVANVHSAIFQVRPKLRQKMSIQHKLLLTLFLPFHSTFKISKKRLPRLRFLKL